MSIKDDKYNVITYLKNYGSDVFDPIDYYQLNRNIYDKNFIELLKYILCLSGNKCKEIDQSAKYLREKIPEFEIIDEIKDVKIITIDTNQLKKLIKELIILINDLYKIFVMLYNLEMGFSYFIQTGNFNYLTQNKDNFEDILIKTNINEEDIENINKFNPNKDKFIPLEYKEYRVDNLDQFNDEELIVLSEMLLEDTVNIEDGIMKLLKLSEKISFIMDIEQISKKILTNIIPKDYLKEETNDVEDFMIMRGGTGLVIEAYNKLFQLKKSLDDLSAISYEKEIPSGINLTVEQIKQLIKNLHIKIENDSVTGLDTQPEKDLKKKKYEYNLFEAIPGYVKIPDGPFIKTPLEPKLPPQQDILSSFKKNGKFEFIETKIIDFDTKIQDISNLISKLTTFYPKIKEYKEHELKFITDLTSTDFIFSNIGKKSDITSQISILNGEITALETEISRKTQSLGSYDSIDKLVEYLGKKKLRKVEEERNATLLSQKANNITKLKELLANYKTGGLGGAPVIDVNNIDASGEIGRDVYSIYNDIFKYITKIPDYDTNTDKNLKKYIETENWSKIEELFLTSFGKEKKSAQQSIDLITESGRKNKYANADFKKIYENIFKKVTYAGTTVGTPSQSYGNSTNDEKIGDILRKLKESSTDSTLQREITDIENSNPNFITTYNSIVNIKPFTDSFWTDINANIINMKNKLETEKNQLILEKNAKIAEKEALNTSLTTFTEEPKYNEILRLNDTLFNDKITYLHKIIENINLKISSIFTIKDGKYENPFKENIGSTLNTQSHGWYKKNLFGGTLEKYILNLKNINEFHEFNELLKKLLLKLDKYKSLSSDLLTIYIDVIKNIQDVIIYLYYKLTVFKNIKESFFTVDIKLKKEELEKLKSEISGINRKNFDFIKEYYIKFIEKILSSIGAKTYVENNIDNKTIFDLLILIHIKKNITIF